MEGKKLYYSPEEWFEAVRKKKGAKIHLHSMEFYKDSLGFTFVNNAKGSITVLEDDAFIESTEITIQCMWLCNGKCTKRGGVELEPRGDLEFNN